MNFNLIIRQRSKSPVRQVPRTCQVSYFKAKEYRIKQFKAQHFQTFEAKFTNLKNNLLNYAFGKIKHQIAIRNKKGKQLGQHISQKILWKYLSKWSRQYKYNILSQSLNFSPTFSNRSKSPKNSVSEFRATTTTKKKITIQSKKLCTVLLHIQNNHKKCLFTFYKIFRLQKKQKRAALYKWYKRTFKRMLLKQKLGRMTQILEKQIRNALHNL